MAPVQVLLAFMSAVTRLHVADVPLAYVFLRVLFFWRKLWKESYLREQSNLFTNNYKMQFTSNCGDI